MPTVDAFSTDVCVALRDAIEEFHPARWFHRDAINSKPTQGTREASYDFCGDVQQPEEFNRQLRQYAPVLDDAFLGEACINRYEPGDWMPEHIDQSVYRYNLVIPLDATGGFDVEGVFHPDTAGVGVLFGAKSPPHSVPVCHTRRYVIIYLYE